MLVRAQPTHGGPFLSASPSGKLASKHGSWLCLPARTRAHTEDWIAEKSDPNDVETIASKGGKARAESLSAERRRQIAGCCR